MSKKELAPWSWGRLRRVDDQPYENLQHEIDRLMNDFWSGRGLTMRGLWNEGALSPRVDETEDKISYHIKVELPGMDEKDVDITLENGLLTIKGEKKQEEEEKGKDFYRKERSFGSFRRTLPISGDVDEAKIKASFKKGVLSIDLPKSEEAKKKVKKISVKAD